MLDQEMDGTTLPLRTPWAQVLERPSRQLLRQLQLHPPRRSRLPLPLLPQPTRAPEAVREWQPGLRALQYVHVSFESNYYTHTILKVHRQFQGYLQVCGFEVTLAP